MFIRHELNKLPLGEYCVLQVESAELDLLRVGSDEVRRSQLIEDPVIQRTVVCELWGSSGEVVEWWSGGMAWWHRVVVRSVV